MANTANFLRRQSSRDMHQQTTAKTLDNLELKVGGLCSFTLIFMFIYRT